MQAAAGREISAAGKQAHRLQIDLLVAALGGFGRGAGLGERRRIEDDHVEVAALLLRQIRQQIKDVRFDEINVGKAIEVGVALCHIDRGL